jgi:hypothetical protein
MGLAEFLKVQAVALAVKMTPHFGQCISVELMRRNSATDKPESLARAFLTVIQMLVAHWSILHSIRSGTYGSVVKQGTLSSNKGF